MTRWNFQQEVELTTSRLTLQVSGGHRKTSDVRGISQVASAFFGERCKGDVVLSCCIIVPDIPGMLSCATLYVIASNQQTRLSVIGGERLHRRQLLLHGRRLPLPAHRLLRSPTSRHDAVPGPGRLLQAVDGATVHQGHHAPPLAG